MVRVLVVVMEGSQVVRRGSQVVRVLVVVRKGSQVVRRGSQMVRVLVVQRGSQVVSVERQRIVGLKGESRALTMYPLRVLCLFLLSSIYTPLLVIILYQLTLV